MCGFTFTVFLSAFKLLPTAPFLGSRVRSRIRHGMAVFIAYALGDIDAGRRGAAFGAIIAAFDIGIGTGSTAGGWLIQRFGFSVAFGTAAALSAVALPYFLLVDRRLR